MTGPASFGAGRFLPPFPEASGSQPGLIGGSYHLQPYGFTPAPGNMAPRTPLAMQPAPASPMAALQQRFPGFNLAMASPEVLSLLQRIAGVRARRHTSEGGFEGRGPTPAGGRARAGSANAGIGGAYGSTAERDKAYDGRYR